MPPNSIRMPRMTSAMPKLLAAPACAIVPASRSFSNTWEIVKPKESSDSEVRITDIRARSALIRVRWNACPVRRAAGSTEIRWGSDRDVMFSAIRFPDQVVEPERI